MSKKKKLRKAKKRIEKLLDDNIRLRAWICNLTTNPNAPS